MFTFARTGRYPPSPSHGAKTTLLREPLPRRTDKTHRSSLILTRPFQYPALSTDVPVVERSDEARATSRELRALHALGSSGSGSARVPHAISRERSGNSYGSFNRCAKRVEPTWGFEPQTCGLRNRCSTAELSWRKGRKDTQGAPTVKELVVVFFDRQLGRAQPLARSPLGTSRRRPRTHANSQESGDFPHTRPITRWRCPRLCRRPPSRLGWWLRWLAQR